MIPIQDLLNRIRWDKDFAQGNFDIGFYDRLQNSIIRVPINDIWFDQDDHFCFYFLDQVGNQHSVPFHRITDVYKNNQRIWHRKHHD